MQLDIRHYISNENRILSSRIVGFIILYDNPELGSRMKNIKIQIAERQKFTYFFHLQLAKMNAKFKEAKLAVKQNEKVDQTSSRLIEATDSILTLIHSLSTPLEEKIAMEDQINKLSHESNCLLDIISNTSRKDYQKKLFLAYREFLKRNIDAVSQRIGKV